MTDEQARQAQQQVQKLQTVRCLAELDAYEAEARRRGLMPGEMQAVLVRRSQLARAKR